MRLKVGLLPLVQTSQLSRVDFDAANSAELGGVVYAQRQMSRVKAESSQRHDHRGSSYGSGVKSIFLIVTPCGWAVTTGLVGSGYIHSLAPH